MQSVARLARLAAMRITYGLAVAAAVLSCTAGELSEDEADGFRSKLKKYYPPETEEGTSDQETDEPSEAPMDEAGAPAPTPTPDPTPDPTPEPTPEPTQQPPVVDAGGGSPTGGDIAPCVTQIMQTACAGAGCHYGGDFNQSPDYGRDNLFELLTTETPAFCPTSENEFIDLETPADSYIMQKVRGQQPNGCGNRMPPPGATALTDEQLTCLEDWFGSLAQ